MTVALIAQNGPFVVRRCVLEGTPCPDGGTPWLLIVLGLILALIIVVAIAQRVRGRDDTPED